MSQSDPEEEFPGAEDGALTAEEVAALAAADRADDEWWPPADGAVGAEELEDEPGFADGGYVDEPGFADGGYVDEPGFADGGFVDEPGQAGGRYVDGLGFADGGLVDEFGVAGGGLGAGFAEGGVLDEAAPSVLLAGLAEEAYQGRDRLDDDRLGGLIRAWRRLAAQAQARELALVAELARRRPQPGSPPAPDRQTLPGHVSEFLADEVAALLTLTTRAAGAEVGLALGLAARRRTADALAAGRIDMPKALILLDLLDPLDEVTAAAIEAAVLPLAAGLTTAQLRAWVVRLILDLDPDAARRRRQAAERHAHVACWQDPEGTASLAGRYLPPAQVLAADRRLAAIAIAWKKHGAHGGMDLLRAHAYLALLLGHDPATPPPGLLIPTAAPVPATTPHQTSASHPTSAPVREPIPAEEPPSAEGAAPVREPIPAEEPPSAEGAAPVREPIPASAQDAAQVRPPGPSRPLPPTLAPAPSGPGVPPPLWLTGTVNLTVPLATLLGLADRAAEADRFGPLHADTARDLATAMSAHSATRWNVIITDPGGRAMGFGGPARARRITKATARDDTTRLGVARGSPADQTARGSPTPFGAGGWTITVSTKPIAPYY